MRRKLYAIAPAVTGEAYCSISRSFDREKRLRYTLSGLGDTLPSLFFLNAGCRLKKIEANNNQYLFVSYQIPTFTPCMHNKRGLSNYRFQPCPPKNSLFAVVKQRYWGGGGGGSLAWHLYLW